MKTLLTTILIFCAITIASAQTIGYLTYGDSTKIFYPGNNEWVRMFLIDSTGTADTVVAESYNPWSATWVPLLMRNDSSGTQTAVMVIPYSKIGVGYTIWLPYPGTFRLRRTDTHALTDKLYYYMFVKGR